LKIPGDAIDYIDKYMNNYIFICSHETTRGPDPRGFANATNM